MYGSVIFKDFVSERDATVVDRLRKAGAIIVGKTTMGEFASGYVGSAFGVVRNAYDLTRIASGSVRRHRRGRRRELLRRRARAGQAVRTYAGRCGESARSRASCSRPFDATRPSLRTSRRPVEKSSRRPARSVTRPPASSMMSAPAAWSQIASR